MRNNLYFKIYDDHQMEYILVLDSQADDAYTLGKLVAFQIQGLLTAYKERFNKDNFIKNLLLDNLLLVDIQNRCVLSIGENELVWSETATVFPPSLSHSDLLGKNIQQKAEEISDQTGNDLLLPSEVQGTKLTYQRMKSRDSWMICILSLLLGLGIFPLAKEKEKQAQAKRFRQMQRDYPDIIQKLILFLKAGLSIQKSVEKLAADYLNRKNLALTGTRGKSLWTIKSLCSGFI